MPPGYQPAHFATPGPASRFGRLATFGRRLGGHVLDSLLYGIAMLLVVVPGIVFVVQAFDDCSGVADGGGTSCRPGEFDGASLSIGVALILLGLAGVAVIYVWALATSGQTWGRKLVGIRVIDQLTGQAPGWGKAIGRTAFAWFISSQIFYVGYLWMLWDEQQQTLHDKVAGTHVIET